MRLPPPPDATSPIQPRLPLISTEPERADAYPRLSEDQIRLLEELGGARHTLAEGEPLFSAGERRGGFNVILSGSVEIVDESGGERRTLATHGPGEFTGDVDVLSRRRPVVTAVARGATEVLSVSSRNIRRIISESPALGEVILRAFIARRSMLLEEGNGGVRVLGPGSSKDSFRIREFLTRNQVPFVWLDTEAEDHVGELLERFGVADSNGPVVVRGSEPLMYNPSTRDLADALGLRPRLDGRTYDLVVVGAGPAGLAAAVYGASEGLGTLVLDASAPGGQAGSSMKIENYLGFPMGITGAELTGRATLQAQKFGADLSAPSEVASIEADHGSWSVTLEDGQRVLARCVLIATGADYRRVDVPGREDLESLGVYYAATQTELSSCRGYDTVVVGAGNAAGQAAMFLSEHTNRVHVLMRGSSLRDKMSSYLAERIEKTPTIEVHPNTVIRRILGEERVEAVEVERTDDGSSWTIETPAVFMLIGAEPRTGWVGDLVAKDAAGFILTGRAAKPAGWTASREPFPLETSQPGIFAAGDVRAGSVKRVTSAVGEGSMVVKYVHECLAGTGDE